LAAGTAVGSVLFAYRGWMYAALAAAFVAGLCVMIWPDGAVCEIPAEELPPNESKSPAV